MRCGYTREEDLRPRQEVVMKEKVEKKSGLNGAEGGREKELVGESRKESGIAGCLS